MIGGGNGRTTDGAVANARRFRCTCRLRRTRAALGGAAQPLDRGARKVVGVTMLVRCSRSFGWRRGGCSGGHGSRLLHRCRRRLGDGLFAGCGLMATGLGGRNACGLGGRFGGGFVLGRLLSRLLGHRGLLGRRALHQCALGHTLGLHASFGEIGDVGRLFDGFARDGRLRLGGRNSRGGRCLRLGYDVVVNDVRPR